ncbi:hypothetical protein OE88DRAFT_1625195 [Heliocybe sulcata]|uniref:Mmc1 C-terminal domain-containing protein n=1 Tax=Heliocybe sulcata TaxID=5364 RepID=A0A5C3NAX1_9AGAM|nr:hypothetical protein OE88DRAFT_1625195 [Heliocybe sulcata]
MFSEVSQKLFGADVPVLVCNPLTTSLTTFVNRDLPVPLSPNAIIIFVSPSTSTEVRAQIISYISQVQHERLHPSSFSTIAEAEGEGPVDLPLRILFVDPARALGAVRTLQKNPSSPKAVEKYQADFTGSNISAFTEALKEVIEPSYPPRAASKDTSIVRLRAQTAQTIAEGALQACRNSLYLEEQEIASLESELGSLEKLVAAVKGSLPQEVLGLKSESGDEVVQALEEAEEALKEVIGRLTWWRATWRVDEVGQIVAAAVERHWCKRLEDRLIYHAGRLMALQGELKTSTDSVLASHVHPSPFDSPVLRNALAQLSSSPSYPINPHVLTSPLTSRLMQITQYPTTRLHLSAQRMVLGLSGSAVSGVGLGLAGWGGYLNSGPLAWVLGYGSMEPMTAVGVGALVGVAGMRWAVGRWERAKKAWWKDWRRVGEGLDRDLRAHLDRTIREQVVVIPEKACGELGGMVERRKASLEKSLNDLQDMRDDLRSLHPERDAKAG